jgi:hypothetical protein
MIPAFQAPSAGRRGVTQRLTLTSILEKASHCAFQSRQGYGEFEPCLRIVKEGLPLHPLGVQDFEQARGALLKTEFGDAESFFRLL